MVNPDDSTGGYVFTTNTLGYESTQTDTTISETTSYLDGKVTIVAGGTMTVDVKGFATNNKFTEADVDVYGYIRLNGRDEPTADNWLTSATRVIAFLVPKDTPKVSIFAKAAGNGTAKISITADKSTYVLDADAPANADGYATVNLDVSALNLTEDTTFYLYNKNVTAGTSNAGLNLKGIMVHAPEKPADVVTLKAIAVKTAPAKEYAKTTDGTATAVDASGLVITATYSHSDGSADTTEDITYSADNKNDFSFSTIDTTTPGEKDVTVTYKEKTATYKATVLDKTLSGYTLSGTLTKTSYDYNEEFDPTGLSVTPSYSDGSAGTATALTATNCTSNYDKTKIGEQSVTITYDGKELTPAQIVTVSKLTQAAPSTSKFTISKTRPGEQTGSITAESADVIANLYVVTDGGDKIWTELATSEDKLTIGNLPKGDYTAYYAETDTSKKSETATLTIEEKVLVAGTFEKFDLAATIKKGSSDLTITANSNNGIKDSSAAIVLTDTNATWQLDIPKNKTFQIKDGTEAWWQGSFVTYDSTYTYTRRAAFNKSGSTLKLKIGNQTTTTLRVDGGGVGSETELTFKGDGTAQTWKPQYEGIKYITIMGDDDGYVTITGSTSVNACIYGIYVVTEIPSTYNAETVVASEYATSYALDADNLTLSAESATNADSQSLTLTIADATDKAVTKTVNNVHWDGTLAQAGTAAAPANADFTYEVALEGAEHLPTVTANTDATLGATISTAGATKGDYTLTVKLGSKKVTKTFKVTSATAYTVTFKTDSSDAGKEYAVDVGDKFPDATTVGLAIADGKLFIGWAAEANATTASYTTADTIVTGLTELYVVLKDGYAWKNSTDDKAVSFTAAGTYSLANTTAIYLPYEITVADKQKLVISFTVDEDSAVSDGGNGKFACGF